MGNKLFLKRTVILGVVLLSLGVSLDALHAQPVIRTPNYTAVSREIDSGEKGLEAAKQLEKEKRGQNTYRGGAPSPEPPEMNMMRLFDKILMKGPGDPSADKWYSPHLRDSQYSPLDRTSVAEHRAQSGLAAWWYGFFCIQCVNGLGGPKTACPFCQEDFFGCPGQSWDEPKDVDWECCDQKLFGRGTSQYIDFQQDSNFKICCVREGEQNLSTEKLSCRYPDGTAWAGLFEYYYPTIALGWENDRTTTMIASKGEVQDCLKKARPIMERQEVNWVEQAIKRNLDQVNKLQGDGGEPATPGVEPGAGAEDLRSKIEEDVKDVRPKGENEDLQFADSLQGAGLTMRVNFPAMAETYRRTVAQAFCMHKDQLLKIMDPASDPLQKPYADLKKIPIWANYCPEGVALMTNPDESLKLWNIDGTPTNLALGTAKWKQDPLFCQRINALKNPHMLENFGGVLAKSWGVAEGFDALNPGAHGFTCEMGGKLNGSLAPVSMYRHAAIERRTAIGDLALGFLIAGGVAAPGMADPLGSDQLLVPRNVKSYYKRFEPQPYSFTTFKIFSGKQFVGGGINERGQACRPVQGERFEQGASQNRSDRLYISDVTHKDVFTQEVIDKDNQGGKGFDRYVHEWANPPAQDKIANRGLNEKSSNYAAAFRIFATCPKGYVRWRHNDPSTRQATIDPVCGEENLGGAHAPIGALPGQ